MMHSSQTSYDTLTPQLAFFSTGIMMNSSIISFLAIALSFFVAQAVTQTGNDSHLRGRSQTPSLASILQIENDSHLRGNDRAPTSIMASVIQIENYSHLRGGSQRGGSQSPTLVSPQIHNSSPNLRIRDTNTSTIPAFDLATNSRLRLRRTEL
jgi:hypothetical protein